MSIIETDRFLKSVSLKVGFINSLRIIQEGADLFRELNMHKFHVIYLSFCHIVQIMDNVF